MLVNLALFSVDTWSNDTICGATVTKANKATHLIHEPYYRQPITVIECLRHCPVLLVPVDQVDLHGVFLAIYCVLAPLNVFQAPVPVELGKLKCVPRLSWEPTWRKVR